MTDDEHELWTTLEELKQSVEQKQPGAPKPDLLKIFGRLDALTDRLSAQGDPALIHYLRRRSYEKARRWLVEKGAARRQAGVVFPK